MSQVVAPTGGSAAERRRRIITGEKTFASDYRPVDLGWPEQYAHALLLRASVADRTFASVDLGRIRPELRPDVLVTATDLAPAFRNYITKQQVELLVTPGQPVDYVGQPVALLLYNDFIRFRRAAQELREDAGPVVYGSPVAAATFTTIEQELEAWRELRCENPQGESHFLFDLSADQSQWTRGKLTRTEEGFCRKGLRDPDSDALFQTLAAGGDGPIVHTTTVTQTVDPAFLEPEAGLAWLNTEDSTLSLLLGTQSPYGDVTELEDILGITDNPRVQAIQLATTDSGGGFGGRDKSPFTFYLALAAIFSKTPVRLAFDRREQFQGGLKRHASAVHSEVRASPKGRLETIRSFTVLRGGPEVNLNTAVLSLAALHATGPYRIQRAGSHAVVLQRPIPTVGSMRGFGIPQVAFNIETAIDRLAVLELRTDPIAFRADNVLHQGTDRDLAGTPLRFHLPTGEICAAAQAHPLWEQRDALRRDDDVRRGVGFACCIEAYGTSSDSVYCAVRVTPHGGVDVWGQTVEMGQGARQSLELVAAEELGQPARVDLGLTGWFEAFGDELDQTGRHKAVKISTSHGSSSASKTAFFHVHALREACRALLRLRLLPAARTILAAPDLSDAELLAGWSDGAVRVPDHRTVPLAELAAEVHRSGTEPGVMIHAYFSNGWSGATFAVDGQTLELAVDALAFVREPGSDIAAVDPDGPLRPPPGAPSGAVVPRSLYASGAHLIGVEINLRQGRIMITDAITFLDPGDIIARPVVDGQVEAGLAMGIAHTLFEELPPETGTGPFSNFDRYRLPRWSDLPAIRRETTLVALGPDGILGPGQPSVRHKGIGEVTMTTVAPATANAIAHALGHTSPACWPTRTPIRFTDLALP
jgi:CO/xanthine dehydrogenase Mo-binding subunit